MGKAILSLNNAYSIPNVKVVGRTCKTNIPSNTAFRGFGGPQAMFVMETIMTQLAAKLNTDVTKVRSVKNKGIKVILICTLFIMKLDTLFCF